MASTKAMKALSLSSALTPNTVELIPTLGAPIPEAFPSRIVWAQQARVGCASEGCVGGGLGGAGCRVQGAGCRVQGAGCALASTKAMGALSLSSTLTPNTVELIPTLGAPLPRGGPLQDSVGTTRACGLYLGGLHGRGFGGFRVQGAGCRVQGAGCRVCLSLDEGDEGLLVEERLCLLVEAHPTRARVDIPRGERKTTGYEPST